MQLLRITDRKQLEILRGRKASFGELHFSFSDSYIEWLSGLLDNKHAYQIFLQDNSEFVGYLASAQTLWEDHLTIVETFIAPPYQGKGIGKQLVERAVAFAKKQGLKGVIVQTEQENLPAQKLYEKTGFRKLMNPEWKGVSYKLSF